MPVPELANIWVGVGADISEFQRKMNTVGSKTRAAGKKMRGVGKSMTKGLTLPIAGAAAGVGKMAADFQSSMNEVEAVTQPTTAQLAEMEETAKKLGRTTQFSASEAASGMKFLGQAGLSASEQIQALPKMLDLAAAGSLDLGQAADIATDLTAGFGLEVSEMGRVNDVLAQTASSATTDVSKMAQTMKQVAPVAKSSGISLEETSAAAGILANSGIKASQAGTQLRGVIAKMEAPTKQQKKVMDQLGVSFTDAQGNTVGLIEAVRRMNEAGASTGEIMQIFGRRAGTAMAALVEQGAPAIRQFEGELKGAQGRAKEMAETKMQGLPGAMKRLKSAFEGAALAIADAGIVDMIVKMAKWFANLFQKVAEVNPTLLKVGVILAGVAAVIGPLLVVIGALVGAIGSIMAVMSPVIAIVAGVVAALAGLAAAIGVAYAKSETFRDTVNSAFAKVKQVVSAAIGVLRTVISGLISWATSAWQRWGGDIQRIASRVWDIVSTVVTTALQRIREIIAAVTAAAKTIWANWGDTIMAVARQVWNAIKNVIGGVLDVILGIIDATLAAIQGDWSGAWNAIKQVLAGILQIVQGLLQAAMATLGRLIMSQLDSIKSAWRSGWEAVKSALKSAWESIKEGVSNGIDEVLSFMRDLPGDITSALGDLGSLLVSAGKDLLQGLIDGIKEKVSSAVSAVTDAVGDTVSAAKGVLGIGSPSKVFMEFASEGIMAGLEKGIQTKQKDVARTVAKAMPGDVRVSGQTAPGGSMRGAGGEGSALADEIRQLRGELGRPNVQVVSQEDTGDDVQRARLAFLR